MVPSELPRSQRWNLKLCFSKWNFQNISENWSSKYTFKFLKNQALPDIPNPEPDKSKQQSTNAVKFSSFCNPSRNYFVSYKGNHFKIIVIFVLLLLGEFLTRKTI